MDDIQNKPEEANPSQALIFLKHLHKELQTIQSISSPALKLRMFALANDLISAKNYFRKLREGLKTKLMHDIDRDVDYEEWYRNHRVTEDELEKQSQQKYLYRYHHTAGQL